jgi:hypothetical protein
VKRIYIAVASAALLLFGCGKYHDFINSEVPQAERHEASNATIQKYLRSLTLYEGFETRARFDALWMTDEMRLIHTALHSERVGLNQEEREAFLLRQLEENNHWQSFYLLAEIPDHGHISLTDKNSSWSLYLEAANGYRVAPESVKEVELAPDIKAMFGHRLTPFKKVFQVKFPAKNLNGNYFFNPDDELQLICAGAGIRGTLTWVTPQSLSEQRWHEEYALKPRQKKGMFSFFSQLAKPSEEDADFFW